MQTLSGTSFPTQELAPIKTLLPIRIPPHSLAPGPIYTSLPIIGATSDVPGSVPIFTQVWIRQLLPILAAPLITIVPLCAIDSPLPNTLGGISNPHIMELIIYFTCQYFMKNN